MGWAIKPRCMSEPEEKPKDVVQPCRTEKVSRDISPIVPPISARRRHAYVGISPSLLVTIYEPVLPNVTLDASLVDLSAALYEDLGLLLRKDGAWRKLLQTEGKVTRKMEMDASSYMEDCEHKPGKKALDILSEKGWIVQRLKDSFHQLGFMDCLDLLESVLGAEETIHIDNGFSVANLNAGPVIASILSQQSIDSEVLRTETDSFSSDQLFGGGDGERIESRSATTDNAAVQVVRPVSRPFDVANDPEEETSGEPCLPNFEMFMGKLEEEAVDWGQDRAGHQESGAGRCKLLLPKSSIPVTQASFVQGSDDANLTEFAQLFQD